MVNIGFPINKRPGTSLGLPGQLLMGGVYLSISILIFIIKIRRSGGTAW